MTIQVSKTGIAACITDVAAMTPTGGIVRVCADLTNRETLIRGLSLNGDMVVKLSRAESSVLRDLLTIVYPET